MTVRGHPFCERFIMSKHQQWKMLYLLFLYARRQPAGDKRTLNERELTEAGVHCDADSREDLEKSLLVERIGNEYRLSEVTRNILKEFIVSKGLDRGNIEMRIDYPEVFVVMAFSEPWSDDVFGKMFKPGIEDAGFDVSRGDSIVRIGDLGTNVCRNIAKAGVVVADVSVPNPNVYYEIGLADALGKPVFLFKQKDVRLPADFSGIHYYEYDRADFPAGRAQLADALKTWSHHPDHRPFGVKALADRSSGT
jgi:hypothetical protein